MITGALAHMKRFRTIAYAMETGYKGPIALPLLLASGSDWIFYLAVQIISEGKVVSIICYILWSQSSRVVQTDLFLLRSTIQRTAMGDSQTIRGLYYLLAAVKCLGKWAYCPTVGVGMAADVSIFWNAVSISILTLVHSQLQNTADDATCFEV